MEDAGRTPKAASSSKSFRRETVGQENKKARAPRVVEGRCEDPKGDGAIKSWRQEDRESPEENTRCNDRQSREAGCLPFDELTAENLNRTHASFEQVRGGHGYPP